MFRYISPELYVSHKSNLAVMPKCGYRNHTHTYWEMLYVAKGEVTFHVESFSREVGHGDLVVIRAGLNHSAEVRPGVDYERFVIRFPEELVPEYVLNKMQSSSAFFGNQKRYLTIFEQFDSYVDNFDEEEAAILFQSDLKKLMVMLCHEYSDSLARSNIVQQVIDYVEEHIYSQLSLQEIANEFNFSKSYISNEFKKAMNIPLMQYVRMRKVDFAQRLILSGEKASYVCRKLGFDNYSTFYRNYLRIFGVAPTAARKKNSD
jgi:AraC-like DNA-binding protein